MSDQPRLYGELAPWWRVLSPPADYRSEAAFFATCLERGLGRPPTSVLELGSGGGHLASHAQATTEWVLSDLSASMVDASRDLNPTREHHVGDMRSLRLGRTFDAVLVHDAASYLLDRQDLDRAIETAAAHLDPGGVALFVPDYTVETFEPGVDCGGHDAGDHSAHYLERLHPLDENGHYEMEFAFLLRDGESRRVEHDRHTCCAFARATWLAALAQGQLEPEPIPLPADLGAADGAEAFLAVRR